MRFLAVITMLVLAFTLAQPVAAQSFKPDLDAAWAAYERKDYATALKHWPPLAEQGIAKAQFNLGVIYKAGQGVTKDYKQAVRWNRKAAKEGHARAQSNLDWMYKHGKGVRKSYKQAARWARKAAMQGHAIAQAGLGYMYANGQGVIHLDCDSLY